MSAVHELAPTRTKYVWRGGTTFEISFDTEDGMTVKVGGRIIELTDHEKKYFYLFVANFGLVCTKSMTFRHLYGSEMPIDYKSLDVAVCKIRSKLGAGNAHLTSVWGRGYMLSRPHLKDGIEVPAPPQPIPAKIRRACVKGVGGETITFADLPTLSIRWVPRWKANLVRVIKDELLTFEEASARYALSHQEFEEWQTLVTDHGVSGLRATRVMQYKKK